MAKDQEVVTTKIELEDSSRIIQKVSDLIFISLRKTNRHSAPQLICYHNPARPDLSCILKGVARYYDLRLISLETILLEQREKLTKLGVQAHDVLTHRVPVPDDVVTAFFQHELNQSASKTKGFMLVNYPMNSAQMAQFRRLKVAPGLVMILEDDSSTSPASYVDKVQIDSASGELFSEGTPDSDDCKKSALKEGHELKSLSEEQKISLSREVAHFERVSTLFDKGWSEKLQYVKADEAIQTSGDSLGDNLVGFFKQW